MSDDTKSTDLDQLTKTVTPQPGDEVTKTVTSDIGDILGAGSMPDVDHAAIDHMREKQAQQAAAFDGLVDSNGRPFDRSLHAVSAGGDPILTKTGKLRVKPGRKGGTTTAARSKVNIKSQEASPQAQPHGVDPEAIRNAARECAGYYWMAMIFLFGEEGEPDSGLGEPTLQETAFQKTFERFGIVDAMPWWLALPAGLALPIALRLKSKEQRDKLADSKSGIIGALIAKQRKDKSHGKGPLPNSRIDKIRKDNVGSGDGQHI